MPKWETKKENGYERDIFIPDPPQPSQDEILSQTIAQLSLDNTDLKIQLAALAQTIATMQLGGV